VDFSPLGPFTTSGNKRHGAALVIHGPGLARDHSQGCLSILGAANRELRLAGLY